MPYLLNNERYQRANTSRLLPSLDLEQLSTFVRDAQDQTSALRSYREALRQ